MDSDPAIATLADGSRLAIRPIEPGDRDLMRAGFERLSPESRYRRFFSPMPELTGRQLDYLTRVDHHDHEALVALDADSGEGIAVARFVRVGEGVAEPAIAVIDDWQGRGVAAALLDRLVERAREEGIQRFAALVMADNERAIRALERLGETHTDQEGPEVELEIDLAEPSRATAAVRGLLSSIADGAVQPALTLWHRVAPRRGAAREGAGERVGRRGARPGTRRARRCGGDGDRAGVGGGAASGDGEAVAAGRSRRTRAAPAPRPIV